MRTFVAIDISDEARNTLASIQSELKDSKADVKWVEPKNIHLTLKFLGEISEETFLNVKNVLDEISSQNRPFQIEIVGLGAFPDLKRPRVIWAGIENGKTYIRELAKKIDSALLKYGFKEEQRGFVAHITLGRFRSLKNIDRLRSILSPIIDNWKVLIVPVSEICLYKSTLTSTGPLYSCLHKSLLLPKESAT